MRRFLFGLTGLGLFIGVVVLVVGLTLLGFGIRYMLTGPEGATEAREQTVGSGTFRIAAYEHFFDLCSSIQGMEGQLDALDAELEGLPEGSDRAIQVRASITGLEGQRARSISRYNADARKDYTIGQFMDADLPYQLDQEGETICEA